MEDFYNVLFIKAAKGITVFTSSPLLMPRLIDLISFIANASQVLRKIQEDVSLKPQSQGMHTKNSIINL